MTVADWLGVAGLFVSVLAMLGGTGKWIVARIDRYTGAVSSRLDRMDRQLSSQDVKITRIEGKLRNDRRH